MKIFVTKYRHTEMGQQQSSAALAIKEEAQRLGFLACGISKVRFLEEEAPRLEAWLSQGLQGSMSWMNDHFDKRLDPGKLVPGAKSVISVLLNYSPPPETRQKAGAPKISRYAWGTDYHYVMKAKLNALMSFIQAQYGQVSGRAFVDSAPVMDRVWARLSGLGWIGKHSLLLTKNTGSYYFIGELIVDLPLEPDGPVTDHCGTCTRCMDACPTEAIIKPYVVDSNKCISHLTIELKSEIPKAFQSQMADWAFGCDICQEVCPWNRFSKPHQEPAFAPTSGLLEMEDRDWLEITNAVFKKRFKSTPIARTGRKGMQRNVLFLRADEKKIIGQATDESNDGVFTDVSNNNPA
jgi:epoxyqueuosine reductase